MNHVRWLLVPVGLALLLSCNGNGTAPSNGNGTDEVIITLTEANRFSPADVTIDPGTTVSWFNAAVVVHTVTPDNPEQPGVWTRTETSTVGTVLTHTFNVAGQTYTYHCEPHLAEGMTGIIRVRAQ